MVFSDTRVKRLPPEQWAAGRAAGTVVTAVGVVGDTIGGPVGFASYHIGNIFLYFIQGFIFDSFTQ